MDTSRVLRLWLTGRPGRLKLPVPAHADLTMDWFKRSKKVVEEPQLEKRSIPAGVFTKCPGCNQALLTADLHKNLDVCPSCDHHFAMATRDRIASIMDEGSAVERSEEHTSELQSLR